MQPPWPEQFFGWRYLLPNGPLWIPPLEELPAAARSVRQMLRAGGAHRVQGLELLASLPPDHPIRAALLADTRIDRDGSLQCGAWLASALPSPSLVALRWLLARPAWARQLRQVAQLRLVGPGSDQESPAPLPRALAHLPQLRRIEVRGLTLPPDDEAWLTGAGIALHLEQ